MGFLASIFGGKREKNPEEKLRSDLFGALCAPYPSVISVDSALTIATEASKGGNVVFSDADRGTDDGAKAFKIAKPYLSGLKMQSLTLDYLDVDKTPLLKEMDLQTDKLVVSRTDLCAQDWAEIQKNIASGGIKSLEVKQLYKDSVRPYAPFNTLEGYSGLESLTFRTCCLRDDDITRLANETVAKSSLKRLDVSDNYARDKGLINLINALPDTIEEFSLSETPLRRETDIVQALADKVEKMPNLKVLDLSGCDLGAQELKILMPKLPFSLKTCNLGEVADGEGMEVVLENLRRPDCNVSETNARVWFYGEKEQELKRLEAQVRQAESDNAQASMAGVQKQKADQIAKAKGMKTPEERLAEADVDTIKTMLHTAVRTGLLDVAFDRLSALGGTLTEKDLNATDDKGETFVQACVKMKRVQTLMRTDVYGNAKDYQAAYNALPAAGKQMFDGRNGRPSFLKLKNQVMAAAVKKAVANKSAGRE